MFDLRYYQTELNDGAYRQWDEWQSTAIIAATASGKTEMYLSLAVSFPGRVFVLAHRDYLLTGPIGRLAKVGFDDVGVEKAESRADVGFVKPKIVFASVQSVGPEARDDRLCRFDPSEFALLVIDEGHRAVSKTYRKVIDHFTRNPKLKVLILTATPKRKDGVALGNVCQSVAGEFGPLRAMSEGWIVPLRFKRRDVQSLDFSGVKLKGADLDPDQVAKLFEDERPLHEVCRPLADDAGPGVVFCPKVCVAHALNALMNSRYRPGRSAVLWEESDQADRDRAFNGLRDGSLDNVFQVDICTEGLDVPGLQRVVWAAPTASLVRYTQGVGRVFRPHDSIARALEGGPEDSESRRQLIACSPKPFGTVVTYYPQNCRHQLCDPVDILGGKDLAGDVAAAAAEYQDAAGRGESGVDVGDALGVGADWINFRKLLDQRLKDARAEAVYSDQEYDGFGGRRARATGGTGTGIQKAAHAASTDWPAGDPMTDKQASWFRWKRYDVAGFGLTKFRAVVVRDLLDAGVSLETAVSYSRRQALAVRDKYKKAASPA